MKINFKAQDGNINSIKYYVEGKRFDYLDLLLQTLKHKCNSSTNKEKYDKAIKYVKEGLSRLRQDGYGKVTEGPEKGVGSSEWWKQQQKVNGGKRQTKKRKHTKRRQTKKRQTRSR